MSLNSQMPCIYLTGFMGAGKSAVGRLLAPRLELPFYDLDKVIEAHEKQRIADLFKTQGEAYFRECELRSLQDIDRGVVALGGGAFIQPEIREMVLQKGKVIFLDWPFSILYRRVRYSKHRPLVDNRTKLESLYELRYPDYCKANLIWKSVEPHRETVKQVVKRIQKML